MAGWLVAIAFLLVVTNILHSLDMQGAIVKLENLLTMTEICVVVAVVVVVAAVTASKRITLKTTWNISLKLQPKH